MSEYKYLNSGEAVRVIGEVDGLIAGYLQVEYAYGDEVDTGDGVAVLLRPSELHDVPPTPLLDLQVHRLQQTVVMLEETILRHRTELAKQEQKREFHKRWLQTNQAWLDVEGVASGRLTHRAEFSLWGRWTITDITIKYGHSQDMLVLNAKRHNDGWEWFWTAQKTRDFREKTQLFESEAAAKAWVEAQLAALDLKHIDFRMGREIMAKAREDGIVCPAHIIEFVDAEAQKKRDEEMARLQAQMAALEKI